MTVEIVKIFIHITSPKFYSKYIMWVQFWIRHIQMHLTLKHRETHGCVVSTVATDALVLKHQAISILSTD